MQVIIGGSRSMRVIGARFQRRQSILSDLSSRERTNFMQATISMVGRGSQEPRTHLPRNLRDLWRWVETIAIS